VHNTDDQNSHHHADDQQDDHRQEARDGQAFYDNAFRELVSSSELSVLPGVGHRDQLGGYVRRIAGSVFCGDGIDPSVVRFATSRAADQWGRAEDEVDVMVGDRLLRTTAALITELQ
jgi:hypothetical protein